MAKKIFAAIISAVMLICMAGCSGNYVMTEEDIAVQKSIEGCWLADDSTGYNEYDGNGNFLSLTAIQFTEDYNYLVYECMPGDGQASGYVRTYPPTSYSFKDKMFKVDVNGVASYARVSVSEDGQTLYWITDEQTEKYNRLTDEQAAEMGIPKYDPATWEETEANPEEGNVTEPEAGDVTESETGSVSENTALGNLVLDPDIKYIASLPHDDYRNYVIAEPENSGIIVYGMYNTENIIIEHDGVTDIFKQEWYTGRGEEPVSGYGDYDGDGENELALIFNMDGYDEETGFEAKPDVLVLYKMGADGHFSEHRFENAKEIAQNEFELAEAVLGDVIFFDIAHFEPAGAFIEFVAMPEFSKNGSRYISAVVTYKDGEFGLTNYKFGRQEEAAALSELKLDPDNKFDKADPIEDYKNYVIAEIPENDIFIYAMEGTDNVIIEHDGIADIFRNQYWLTPRRILPTAAYADYDGDGEKELAVSYYVGSGTGMSIDELVIYEKDSGGHFTEHKFKAPEDILNEKLTVEIDEENTSVNFTFDGKSVTKNYGEEFEYIKNILDKYEDTEFRFGDIISFNFEGDKITLTGSAGLLTMYYAAYVTADVEYADGSFTLTNFEFDAEE